MQIHLTTRSSALSGVWYTVFPPKRCSGRTIFSVARNEARCSRFRVVPPIEVAMCPQSICMLSNSRCSSALSSRLSLTKSTNFAIVGTPMHTDAPAPRNNTTRFLGDIPCDIAIDDSGTRPSHNFHCSLRAKSRGGSIRSQIVRCFHQHSSILPLTRHYRPKSSRSSFTSSPPRLWASMTCRESSLPRLSASLPCVWASVL